MAETQSKHEYLILKKFKGVNTQPSREALQPNEFAWLENAMPIGDSFMQVVPAPGTATATISSSAKLHFASIGTVNYQINFTTAGGAQAVNLATGNVATIFSAGTFGSVPPAVDQWKSERIVITDSNGMFSWDGSLAYSPGSLATISVIASGTGFTSTPAVVLTGGTVGTTASAQAILASGGVSQINIFSPGNGYTSAPTVSVSGGGGSGFTGSAFIMPSGMDGQAISVFSGRVWVSKNRTLSFTAPNTWYDTNIADAAGSTTITEGSLRQRIYGMEALDNYLYVFGDSSIIIIGDLKVTNNITTFSQTFLSSTTGSTLPDTITAMERAIIFVNKYGVYALFGASVQKVSKALDGVFPKIDFTQPVSAGLVNIANILCYAFNFTYEDTNANRSIQAVFFDGKWFFTSQGNALQFVSSGSINGVISLWGTSGTDLRLLYSDSNAAIASKIQTGLYDMGNPIQSKQVITAGIEYTAPAAASLNFEVDTEIDTLSTTSTSGSTLTWFNSPGNEITWVNNGNNEITWVATLFLLDYFPVALSGKYLGATITSNSPMLVINGVLMEFQKMGFWARP